MKKLRIARDEGANQISSEREALKAGISPIDLFLTLIQHCSSNSTAYEEFNSVKNAKVFIVDNTSKNICRERCLVTSEEKKLSRTLHTTRNSFD